MKIALFNFYWFNFIRQISGEGVGVEAVPNCQGNAMNGFLLLLLLLALTKGQLDGTVCKDDKAASSALIRSPSSHTGDPDIVGK